MENTHETVTVTLRFRNRADRNEFMGGLCDGWGENACSLDWGQENGVNFYETDTYDVSLYRDDEDDSDEDTDDDFDD